jgi:hypothetical protein
MDASGGLPKEPALMVVVALDQVRLSGPFAIMAGARRRRGFELYSDASVRLVAPDGLGKDGFQKKQPLEADE